MWGPIHYCAAVSVSNQQNGAFCLRRDAAPPRRGKPPGFCGAKTRKARAGRMPAVCIYEFCAAKLRSSKRAGMPDRKRLRFRFSEFRFAKLPLAKPAGMPAVSISGVVARSAATPQGEHPQGCGCSPAQGIGGVRSSHAAGGAGGEAGAPDSPVFCGGAAKNAPNIHGDSGVSWLGAAGGGGISVCRGRLGGPRRAESFFRARNMGGRGGFFMIKSKKSAKRVQNWAESGRLPGFPGPRSTYYWTFVWNRHKIT
jgi:hypothetical protein